MDAPSQAAQAVLFRRDWSTTGLAKAISNIDRNDLSREHGELKRRAPRRHAVPKEYFRGHEGRLSPRSETTGGSNRFEEHLAIALWRMWRRPGMGRVRLLDYQVPLKAGRCRVRARACGPGSRAAESNSGFRSSGRKGRDRCHRSACRAVPSARRRSRAACGDGGPWACLGSA